MNRPYVIVGVFLLQLICAGFFLSDIVVTLFSLPVGPISWRAREVIEIGAAVGLIMGAVLGYVLLRRTVRRSAQIENQLRAVSGAFMDLLEERFEEWALTPAERDVALFAIKGLSTADIAGLRDTSEGTVKAQTAAIYRKAGVTGRPQLLSLFIDDLMDGAITPEKDTDKMRSAAQ